MATLDGTAWTLGQVGASQSNTYITAGAVQLRNNTTVKVDLQSDGDVLIGTDTSAAATTTLSVFSAAQTYNGETMGVGDLLLGDNSSGKANLWWDKSAGTLNFRGGTATQAYVDTTGAIVAGGGEVVLNSTGFKAGLNTTNYGMTISTTGKTEWYADSLGLSVRQAYYDTATGDFSIGIGDALLWDSSADKLLLQGTMDVTGEIVAGAGAVKLDASGITIETTDAENSASSIEFTDSGTVFALMTAVDGAALNALIARTGNTSTAKNASSTLSSYAGASNSATTYVVAGLPSKTTQIVLNGGGAIEMATDGYGGVKFPSLTTTQRDAIAVLGNGTVVWNSTATKLQVYTGSGWVDLH
jgi:hypothetical protein